MHLFTLYYSIFPCTCANFCTANVFLIDVQFRIQFDDAYHYNKKYFCISVLYVKEWGICVLRAWLGIRWISDLRKNIKKSVISEKKLWYSFFLWQIISSTFLLLVSGPIDPKKRHLLHILKIIRTIYSKRSRQFAPFRTKSQCCLQSLQSHCSTVEWQKTKGSLAQARKNSDKPMNVFKFPKRFTCLLWIYACGICISMHLFGSKIWRLLYHDSCKQM